MPPGLWGQVPNNGSQDKQDEAYPIGSRQHAEHRKIHKIKMINVGDKNRIAPQEEGNHQENCKCDFPPLRLTNRAFR